MVKGHRECRAETKGDGHPCERDCRRKARVASDDSRVDLETDEEQKEAETDVGDKREIWYRIGGEDVFFKSWDAAERGGTCDVITSVSSISKPFA